MDGDGDEGGAAAQANAPHAATARTPTAELIRTHRAQITLAALLLFAAAAAGVDDRPLMFTLAALAPIVAAAAVKDAHTLRIPTELTITAAAVAAIALAGAGASTGAWAGYARALTAAVAGCST